MPLPTPQRRTVPPTWLMLLVIFAAFVYWAGEDTPTAATMAPEATPAETIKTLPIQLGESFHQMGFGLEQAMATSRGTPSGGQLDIQAIVHCLAPGSWQRLKLELLILDQLGQPLKTNRFDLWRHPTLAVSQGDGLPFSLSLYHPNQATQVCLNIIAPAQGTNAARPSAARPSAALAATLARQAPFFLALTPSLTTPLLSTIAFRGDLARHTSTPTAPGQRNPTQRSRPVAGCDDLRFALRDIHKTAATTTVWLAVDHQGREPITAGRLRLCARDDAGRVLAQDTLILTKPSMPYLDDAGRRLLHARLAVDAPVADWTLEVVSLERQSPTGPKR